MSKPLKKARTGHHNPVLAFPFLFRAAYTFLRNLYPYIRFVPRRGGSSWSYNGKRYAPSGYKCGIWRTKPPDAESAVGAESRKCGRMPARPAPMILRGPVHAVLACGLLEYIYFNKCLIMYIIFVT